MYDDHPEGRNGSARGYTKRRAGTAIAGQVVIPVVAGLDKWSQTYVL
jgi:hypothetical protein